ncbi:HTH-type transcriptional regulator DmlR [compost metagenome]
MPDAQLTARLLAPNRRILCAAPSYLKRAGMPTQPAALQRHSCLFIRESDDTFGTWHLRAGTRQESVKVRGPLSSNDGDCALSWALDGHGILMRSLWDVAPYLRSGRLEPVLADWSLPNADIYLVFPNSSNLSAKTRALVDFMVQEFAQHKAAKDEFLGW